MDKIYRVTTANQLVRVFIADTTELVNQACDYHKPNSVGAAALGRLLTAGAMMGQTLKGDNDLLTLKIAGNGLLGGVLVTADSKSRVKGFINNPLADLPPKTNGKIDVSGGIGNGTLTVIKDLGMKEPYVGQVELISGEIAEDLTYYYASSEQTPSVVALGVLVDKDLSIIKSGGFIVQLMPGADEETIAGLENNIEDIKSMTDMMSEGLSLNDILDIVLKGMDYTILEEIEPVYFCNCDRDRVERALISIGKVELEDIINEGEPIEMNCQFCNKDYHFNIDEIKKLLESSS